MTDRLCGLPHYDHPETLCTEPAGHYKPGWDPHAGPLIIDGRHCGGVAWDEPAPAHDAGPSVAECADNGATDG
ncbi:hypothetical protein ABT186_01795 [Streptomyces sp. NPDC001634]|uniref:hypothetical protein n=1 Tax=Streptomyces sp. NPDC001634 TaxID=3154390 RepID=UPI00331B8DA1